ncbi:hypothetical protein [Bacteroides cellulosilyticus]|jgi:hypothetical protein|uniref:Right-handed parallel beta-helix repeat-containing protein n=3 Tax=Bacteroides cellulosilyticus TaxID=246787 RepID=A0A642PVR0_9BACE|nr:hypothetical protein [Bacteroides cellulosilyticus]KAA5417531.1 hypothetical protein F2Y81_13555 [Bacteroides cellulosilyticus]
MRNDYNAFIVGLLTSCFLIFYPASSFAIKDIYIRVSTILRASNDNVLSTENLPRVYSKLIVDVKCDLEEKCLILPSKAELVIEEKGYIDNGIIKGNNSVLTVMSQVPAIGLKVLIAGTWNNAEVYDSWFDFDNSPNFISNRIIENILLLTDDFHFCHIYFQADRNYFFELPYKGEANLGDKLPYSMVGKTKKRKYVDLYNDNYSFLRIFTIPSNTHLTIHNHLKMLPTNQGAYFIFWEYGKKNVIIDGEGSISGDVREHMYDTPFIKGTNFYGEWGYIFCCRRCVNFYFKDITIGNSFGDCILYTADYTNKKVLSRFSRLLVVDNVKIKYARRNGIVIGAQNVVIQNSLFEGCGIDSIKGTAPRAAIDFEPDGIRVYPETGNDSVYMRNCVFVNNKYDVSSTLNNLETFNKVATYISNCEFTAPLRLNTTNWIEFNNCIIEDITNFQYKITEKTPIKHVIFKYCTIKRMPSILLNASWDNFFLQCRIIEIDKSML